MTDSCRLGRVVLGLVNSLVTVCTVCLAYNISLNNIMLDNQDNFLSFCQETIHQKQERNTSFAKRLYACMHSSKTVFISIFFLEIASNA